MDINAKLMNESFLSRYANIEEKVTKSFTESIDDILNDNTSIFTEVDSKRVQDSNGFMTDYTMYKNNEDGTYVFVFGDKDMYTPDDGDFDWEAETEEQAREWFDNYTGFEDEDHYDSDESLSEDTEKKSNGKWVNKGSDGEHGEFDTKKEADAQRKAMFANGYEESLEEDNTATHKYVFFVNTGSGAAYRDGEYDKVHKYVVKAPDLDSAARRVYARANGYQKIKDCYLDYHFANSFDDLSDEAKAEYKNFGTMDYWDTMDMSSGDPFIVKIVEDGKVIYDEKDNWDESLETESLHEDFYMFIDNVDTDVMEQTIRDVMSAYQNANKWLDSVKETVYSRMSCPFFSSFIHKLAHTMPARFDKFGDILHTTNLVIPYPATEEIDHEPTSIDDVFGFIFGTLDAIKTSLTSFIKCTDEQYHGMSCAAEELLNDIESEYPMLYRLRDKWSQCEGDVVEFDKYVQQYVDHKDDLLESVLNEAPTFSDADMYDPQSISLSKMAQAETDAKEAEKRDFEIRSRRDALRSKYEDVIEQISNSDNRMDTAFELLVPAQGKADTLAGELVRAMMRVLYRDYNDGDLFYEGYGLETAAPSVAYIYDMVDTTQQKIEDIMHRELRDKEYTNALNDLSDIVIDYIIDNPETFDTAPDKDSRDYDCDWIIDQQPHYEFSLDAGDNNLIYDAIQEGFVDAFYLNDYIEDILEADSSFEGAEVERPWSHTSTEVTVTNLTREGLDELERQYKSKYFWNDLEERLRQDGFGESEEDIDSDEE